MRKLFLIRHGITEGTKNNLFYGWTDMPLTEEGRKELAKLRDRGMYPKPTGAYCFTSGMTRTEETFNIIYGELEHAIIPELKEVNLGELEMKSYEDVLKHEDTKKWITGETDSFDFPGGENKEQFDGRVVKGITTLLTFDKADKDEASNKKKDIIAVAHGAVIMTAMNYLFPREQDVIGEWIPRPGFGYEIDFAGNDPVGYCKIDL